VSERLDLSSISLECLAIVSELQNTQSQSRKNYSSRQYVMKPQPNQSMNTFVTAYQLIILGYLLNHREKEI